MGLCTDAGDRLEGRGWSRGLSGQGRGCSVCVYVGGGWSEDGKAHTCEPFSFYHTRKHRFLISFIWTREKGNVLRVEAFT